MNEPEATEPVDAEAQEWVGRVLAQKYQLLRLLGAGGMGAVYEAQNTWLRRAVAVKVLRTRLTQNREVAQRFIQEAQTAAQLRHPNIVDVLDLGEDPTTGALFIVQELLAGQDLRRHMDAAGPMGLRAALEVLAPVMRALTVAHARGIVHRDIKPENIFLARDPDGGPEVPKVIDFGISKVLDAGRAAMKTSAGATLGTPYYMSPEQACGEPSIDARADVWSVAVVLYEALSGARPFEAPTQPVLFAKILTEPPRPLEQAWPEAPPDVAAVLRRALSADRAARYASMAALHDALMACASVARATAGGAAATPGAASAVTLGASVASVAPGTVQPAVTPVVALPAAAPAIARRGRAVVAAGVAAVAAALFAVGVWSSRRAQPAAAAPPIAINAPPTPVTPLAPAAAPRAPITVVTVPTISTASAAPSATAAPAVVAPPPSPPAAPGEEPAAPSPRPRRAAAQAPARVAPVVVAASAPPAIVTPPAPVAPRPVVARPSAPRDPVVSMADRLASRAQQLAAVDPRRARRLTALATDLRRDADHARELDRQAAEIEMQNPRAANRWRVRAARIREDLALRATRLSSELY